MSTGIAITLAAPAGLKSKATLPKSGAHKIQVWLTAHSVTTLLYFIAKGRSVEQDPVTLTSLLQFLKIAPVDQNTIEQALNLPYRDFEDAVQMMAALELRADC
jgi:hypothetical protein